MLDRIRLECKRVTLEQIMGRCEYSRSQLYEWQRGISPRKERKSKIVSEETVEKAVDVIMTYPHMGGRKGQAYMIYHRLGYVSMNGYDQIKKSVKRLVFQEVSKRQLIAAKTGYEHEKPENIGQIWAEDFTDVVVSGSTFKVGLLIDVASQYNLGVAVSPRADASLVEKPVMQALASNGGKGPEKFLLSDNGSPYVSDEHGRLLEKVEIIQKRIPSCVPQYNGAVECGVKEFKNVFYNVWAKQEGKEADKEKNLLFRVDGAVKETVRLLNEEIPRPSLKGVTPADMQRGLNSFRIEANRQYLEKERIKEESSPWKRNYWDVLKEAMGLKQLTGLELMTKFCFFCLRPLRKIAKLELEGVG